MSYDPYRNNILPEIGSPFPITEELPAVSPRGGGPRGRLFLWLVGAVLIIGIAATAAILIIDNQRSTQVASGDAEPTATPPPNDNDQTPAPTVTELENGEPGYVQVVGVDEGLNVRSGPGTDNAIVGSLAAGSRHVFATGERANVNGAEWTQVRLGTDNRVGWVSARFLAADTEPSDDDPTPTPVPTAEPSGSTSVVCFFNDGSTTQVARLVFTNRTEISGVLRSIGAESTIDQAVAGTLDNGEADVTLTNTESNARARQTWTFNPASVDVGNSRSLAVVSCDTVASQLG